MAIIEWPSPQLAPLIIDPQLINRSRSGGESLTGFEQVGSSIAGRWRVRLQFANLKRQFIPSWRAMVAALDGRQNLLRVPMFDPQFRPTDAEIGAADATHSDGTSFGDGSLYSAYDIDGVTASGSRGVTSLEIDLGSYGAILSGGQYFGVGEETYLALSVTYVDSVATVNFKPSLRQDHTASVVRLRPRMIMRLVDDEQGALALTRGIIGAPSLELLEILPDELLAIEGT